MYITEFMFYVGRCIKYYGNYENYVKESVGLN